MNWDLKGLWIQGKYLGDSVVSGVVESTRVKYGGGVQHTVVLDKPIKFRWRSEPADRLLIDHEHVLRVADQCPSA